ERGDDPDHGEAAGYVGAEGGCHGRVMLFTAPVGGTSAGPARGPDRSGSGRDVADDARSFEPAVAVRDLVEVLLVVVLGVVEGARGSDFGRDRVLARAAQICVVGVTNPFRRLLLRIVDEEDPGAVGRPYIVPLAHALGRVVLLEEHLQQILVGDLGR